jgi:uncharacterized protein YegP (UPF0339 family)
MEDKWYFYKDRCREWRWKRVARDGRVVGVALKGYEHRIDCVGDAIRNGCRTASHAVVPGVTR